MKGVVTFFLFLFVSTLSAQVPTQDTVGKKVITLSEVILDKKLNVEKFISTIQEDSSFYKAFKNLRQVGYDASNDIRMRNKKGDNLASLQSKTRQLRLGGCRTMQVIEEQVQGDFYDTNGDYNYYTAAMYASLFFTKGKICGETNIIGNEQLSTSDKKGMEKHKEQLKMLFFNPGRKIKGLPFMSGKTAIYDDDIADEYDMQIDFENLNGKACYVFTQTAKPKAKGKVVVDKMKTWFDETTMDVVARNYSLSYDAIFYDFKVDMEVQIKNINGVNLPYLIRYNGDWKAVTKKRERGIFTATLYNFLL
jgi:hypothetical protein